MSTSDVQNVPRIPSMRQALILLLLGLAPGVSGALSLDETRHLLTRTGFGLGPEAYARWEPLSYDAAVRMLLAHARTQARTAPPAWVDAPLPDLRKLRQASEAERKALRERQRAQALELKGWWYTEMLTTDSPLTERMTLFWHNHFTSSLQKVRAPALMYRQNALLRRHALGNFGELLHAIARDPAMILYLDNQTNRKSQPNENFARELLELFTLGEGHYGERDIKEAARAFSGWMVDRTRGEYRFNTRQHDGGVKTFLGRSGRFDGHHILDILLQQPRTAEYIVQKLWREFVSETPDPAEVKRLAALFRAGGYEMKPLLQALFTTAAFRAPTTRGTLVKSPAELIVGTLRFLDSTPRDATVLARVGALLGQNLLDPPNVKGWPGGTTWISSQTLLAREQFLDRALVFDARDMSDAAAARVAGADRLQGLLLPLEPAYPIDPELAGAARLRQVLLDPVYQLK